MYDLSWFAEKFKYKTDTVMTVLKEKDPGVKQRKKRRLERRIYRNKVFVINLKF